jgi:hypothetical protein
VTQQSGELILVNGGVASTLATVPVCFSSFDPAFHHGDGSARHRGAGPVDLSLPDAHDRHRAVHPGPVLAGQATNEIVRLTLSADDTVDLASLEIVLTGIGAATGHHNGGCLRIGPDQKLYASTGENDVLDPSGPPGSSMNPYAQDLADLRGKILRLELDGTPARATRSSARPARAERSSRSGSGIPSASASIRYRRALGRGRRRGHHRGDRPRDRRRRLRLAPLRGHAAPGCALPGDIPPVLSYPHTGPARSARP